MTVKESKTAAELATLIVREVRQLPGCGDILDVKISRVEQGPSNWTASFTMTAVRSEPWPLPPPTADEVVRRIQAQFDLV